MNVSKTWCSSSYWLIAENKATEELYQQRKESVDEDGIVEKH